MNTSLAVSLDTRRQKKDLTYPLIIRLTHNSMTTSLPLGISVKVADWDDKNKVVRKTYVGISSITRLNNIIQKRKSDALDVILKLHEDGKLAGLPLTDLRSHIDKVEIDISFSAYGDKQVEELLKANRIGTARSYKGVLSVLKKFHGKSVQFNDLNYSFLKKFETFHKANGNQTNGLAVYMRTIRAVYNKAIKEGLANREQYPFAEYKIKTTATEKRALDITLLNKVVTLNLIKTDPLFNTRNIFVASYMMYGMNYTDMALLKKENIADGRIIYKRSKTGKIYDIKITPALQTLLDHYKSDSDYIFPIIKRKTAIEQNKDILWAMKRYNKKLKLLAEKCGIDKNLTSYVSRHSFATQAMMQQVPLPAISSMLGHSSLKTTEIYLKGLPSNILDDYNSLIMKNL